MTWGIGHNGGPVMEDRWYQEEAVDALFDFFNEHGGTDSSGKPVKANPLVAMPTGTGKSVVIAKFLQRVFEQFPQSRVIMATHVKELIEQNGKKLLQVWPNAPMGFYSAGLKKKDYVQPIIFGGIKSMIKNVEWFGFRDLLVIDEAHLVSPNADTSYLTFILKLMEANPYLKVIGLSATIYRMKLGLLTNGNIFSHIAYDITNIEGFNRLIAEGYLCPPIPRRTETQLEIGNVGISSSTGDYNEAALQEAIDKSEVTYAALKELVGHGWNRRSWVVFAAGIEHAEHINEMLNNVFGVPSTVVHSKMSTDERDKRIERFKAGEFRCIVNKDILTTGFDHPPIDLIGMLRPTMSTGLWIQMLGRGTRPNPGKENCLVLDYAKNTARLGPINDPVIPRPRGSGPPGDAPIKMCPACPTYNHASAKFCSACNYEFEAAYTLSPNIDENASTDALLASDLPQVERFEVVRVVYTPHHSVRSGKSTIKVAYYCDGFQTFFEYIAFEGVKPYAIHQAHDWLRQRTERAEGMIEQMENYPGFKNQWIMNQSGDFRIPRAVNVWVNKGNGSPQVMNYEF